MTKYDSYADRARPKRCDDCDEEMEDGVNRKRCKICGDQLCIPCTKVHRAECVNVTGVPV